MTDEDHDLLIKVSTTVDFIKEKICNHLKHHMAYNLIMVSGSVTIILSLVGIIVKLILQ